MSLYMVVEYGKCGGCGQCLHTNVRDRCLLDL
jgi:hypothetical protein